MVPHDYHTISIDLHFDSFTIPLRNPIFFSGRLGLYWAAVSACSCEGYASLFHKLPNKASYPNSLLF
jgi:hypothetical protein